MALGSWILRLSWLVSVDLLSTGAPLEVCFPTLHLAPVTFHNTAIKLQASSSSSSVTSTEIDAELMLKFTLTHSEDLSSSGRPFIIVKNDKHELSRLFLSRSLRSVRGLFQ